MRFGFLASLLLHLSVVGAFFVWGADWTRSEVDYEPPIPVALISEAELAEKTEVPAMTTEPEDLTEPEVPDDPVPVIQEVVAASEPEEIVPLAAPPPPIEEPAEPEQPVEEPEEQEPEPVEEPDPPKPDPPVQKKEDPFSLDDLAGKARALQQEQNTRQPAETTGPIDTPGTGGTSLTASEDAMLRAHLTKCWTPNRGAPDPESLIVEISFKLNTDGTLASPPKVVNSAIIARSNNAFWRSARDEAVQAVNECQPYDFFSTERYREEFTFTFRPTGY